VSLVGRARIASAAGLAGGSRTQRPCPSPCEGAVEYEPAQHMDPAVVADIASWVMTADEQSEGMPTAADSRR
jgi:hypothetical protein